MRKSLPKEFMLSAVPRTLLLSPGQELIPVDFMPTDWKFVTSWSVTYCSNNYFKHRADVVKEVRFKAITASLESWIESCPSSLRCDWNDSRNQRRAEFSWELCSSCSSEAWKARFSPHGCTVLVHICSFRFRSRLITWACWVMSFVDALKSDKFGEDLCPHNIMLSR